MTTRCIVLRAASRRALPALAAFARDDRGATVPEYGLLVALIACVAIAGMQFFGNGVDAQVRRVDAEFRGATGG